MPYETTSALEPYSMSIFLQNKLANQAALLADISHLLSIFILLQKMKSSSVCACFEPIFLPQPQTNVGLELFGDIIQVTIALPDCLRHSISWYLTFQPPYTRPYTHLDMGKMKRLCATY